MSETKELPPPASSPFNQENDRDRIIAELTRANSILKANISTLYRTARAEIARKNDRITELQSSLDDLIFKRMNHRTVHSGSTPFSTNEKSNGSSQVCPVAADTNFDPRFVSMYDSSMYSDMLGPLQEDRLGMTVTSGQVKIVKDQSNLIGISIGGGAPHCPCLYVIQIFDNTPAALEGTLEPGDELTAINGVSVKGATRTEVAQAIQKSKDHVIINYNKLHADTSKAKSLDIILKKLKHRLTENISPTTADAFGLSRAILCNDTLVKRLEELQRNELMYSEIRERTHNTFKAFYELNHIYKEFGDVFTEIGCREKQPEAGEAFRRFGETHRLFEKYGLEMLNSIKTMLGNLDTYISKAIPDTKLTISKYEDIKFEYLSYCLKVKEMDDEEKDYYSMHEPLFRVETGNYEYRLILRCRQEARKKFSRLRSDVTAKIELLDQKHVQHLSSQLQMMVSAMAQYNSVCMKFFSKCVQFPLDMDLSQCFDFNYTDEQDLTEDNDESSLPAIANTIAATIDTTTTNDIQNDAKELIDIRDDSSEQQDPKNKAEPSSLLDG